MCSGGSGTSAPGKKCVRSASYPYRGQTKLSTTGFGLGVAVVVGAVKATPGFETLCGEWRRTKASAPPAAIRTTAPATSPHRSHRREPGLGMAAMLATAHPGTAWMETSPAGWEETMTMSEFLPKLLARVYALPAAGPLLPRLGNATAVYLVGGAVRDLLLGGAPFDLDLVVEGDTAAVAAALGGEVREHDRFGTETVVLDGFTYDLARA